MEKKASAEKAVREIRRRDPGRPGSRSRRVLSLVPRAGNRAAVGRLLEGGDP